MFLFELDIVGRAGSWAEAGAEGQPLAEDRRQAAGAEGRRQAAGAEGMDPGAGRIGADILGQLDQLFSAQQIVSMSVRTSVRLVVWLVGRSFSWLAGWSVCQNFQKEREFSLSCSYRNLRFAHMYIYLYLLLLGEQAL